MYKLTKHYRKYLFAFECQFDRGEIDPAPIVTELEETVKEFKDDLDMVEFLWKVAIGVKSKSSANNVENQPSPTPSLGSQDSVDLSDIPIFSESSSETDSEAIHPSEPAFGTGEPSSPSPTKNSPGASYAEYLCLIILTISYLLIYYAY